MLKQQLNHPQILEALAAAGHGSKILITDGNYPASTTLGENADLVHLNLCPGRLTGTEVLEAICSAVPIEGAAVMETLKEGPYAMTEDPSIWAEFRTILDAAGNKIEFEQIERFAFYDAAGEPEVALVIQTGEQRIYANLLLTIGVVLPE